MRRARHTYLVEKATQAAVSAIEVYNKPGFAYREETFAILMLNAWELLLKARILREIRISFARLKLGCKADKEWQTGQACTKEEPGRQHDDH